MSNWTALDVVTNTTNLPVGGAQLNSAMAGLCRVGSTHTATGQSDAEAAAGVTPVTNMFEEGDIRRYGALGAGEDNTSHINNTLAVCAVSGRPARLAGLKLVSTGGHVHDISKHIVDGEGAIIDFSTMTSGAAWSLTSTTGPNLSGQHARNALRHIAFSGNTTTPVGTGLLFNNASSGGAALAVFAFIGIGIDHFVTGILFQANTYILDFFGVSVSKCTTGVNLANASNAGEKITFHGGGISNNYTAIVNANSTSDLWLESVSVDTNTIAYNLSNGSQTHIRAHTEFVNAAGNPAIAPIQISGGNTLAYFNGGCIIADGTAPFAWPSMFQGSTGTIYLNNSIFLLNVNGANGVLASGGFNLVINAPIAQLPVSGNPKLVGVEATYSLLQDGSFEQASFFDNISILGDTTYLGRTTGTNLSLALSAAAAHSGTHCLAVTKMGAAGTAAAFGIVIPVTLGMHMAQSGYINCTATQVPAIGCFASFCNVIYGQNPAGIPSLYGTTDSGVVNIAPTAGTWQIFNVGPMTVPPDVNAYVMRFNLNAVGPGTYYFDDLVITAM